MHCVHLWLVNVYVYGQYKTGIYNNIACYQNKCCSWMVL